MEENIGLKEQLSVALAEGDSDDDDSPIRKRRRVDADKRSIQEMLKEALSEEEEEEEEEEVAGSARKLQPLQLRISKNGDIFVDESTLVISAAERNSAYTTNMPVIKEAGRNYGRRASAKRARPSGKWSAVETRQFYGALAQCGTNFQLMTALLPGKTRNEIKSKFSREERSHPLVVSLALQNPVEFDISKFEGFLSSAAKQEEKKETKKMEEPP